MVSRIITGTSIDLKVMRSLNINVTARSSSMVTKVIGTRMRKELNRGGSMIPIGLVNHAHSAHETGLVHRHHLLAQSDAGAVQTLSPQVDMGGQLMLIHLRSQRNHSDHRAVGIGQIIGNNNNRPTAMLNVTAFWGGNIRQPNIILLHFQHPFRIPCSAGRLRSTGSP